MIVQAWKCTSKGCDCGELYEHKKDYVSHLKEVGKIRVAKRLGKRLLKSLRLRSAHAANKANKAGADYKSFFNFLNDNQEDLYRLACYQSELLYTKDSKDRFTEHDLHLFVSSSVRYHNDNDRVEIYASLSDSYRRVVSESRACTYLDEYFVVYNGNSYRNHRNVVFYENSSGGFSRSRNKELSLSCALKSVVKLDSYMDFTLKNSPWEFLNDEYSTWKSEAEEKFNLDCEHKKNVAILQGVEYEKESFYVNEWIEDVSVTNYLGETYED